MKRVLLFATVFACLASAASAKAQPTPAQSESCTVSPAEKMRNRTLSWGDFDLSPQNPRTAMWFSSRGCYGAALTASEDYLAFGPVLSHREKAAVLFHMARNAAMGGDEKTASLLAAASRRADQAPDAPLDWNTYVTGAYAFFTKDAPTLKQAYEKLAASSGEGDKINSQNLGRLVSCFDKTYKVAMESAACAKP